MEIGEISILKLSRIGNAWKISWTEEPGGLQSMGLQRIRHDWATEHAQCFKICFIQPNMWKYCHFSILLKQNINKIAAAAAKSLQSCPTLCDLIDSSPPGSPVPGILQARTLEWVPISSSNAWKWKVKMKSLSPVLPGSSIHGIFQARVLEWGAKPPPY